MNSISGNRINVIKSGLLAFLAVLLTGLTTCIWGPEESFTNSAGIRMIGIPAGSFRMGDQVGDGQWDEQPVRKVAINHSFYLSETEITVEQFRLFRPDYDGFESYAPFATGISWNDAMAFCHWLSEKEDKIYRLPTEAEWEYACRDGNLGLENMQEGPVEWCYDWYGPYPFDDQDDPTGLDGGYAKVIRGGLPDDKTLSFDHPVEYYSRAANRASLAPAFAHFLNLQDTELLAPPEKDYDQFSPGLTGVLFDDNLMEKPLLLSRIRSLDSEELNWPVRNDWSAYWKGFINAPYTGKIDFYAEAVTGLRLIIEGDTLIHGWNDPDAREGSVDLVRGQRYPIAIQYLKDPDDDSRMLLSWAWEDKKKHSIPAAALSLNRRDDYDMKVIFNASLEGKLREASIGFRVVQADLPGTDPVPVEPPFAMQGVRQDLVRLQTGPDPAIPYFRKRHMLPLPPDNTEAEHTLAAGVDPYFSWHNHNPALTVCPNGDLLYAFFTASYEDEPEVAYGTTRLRFGADQWEWPSRLLDFADVNDVAPLLWNDNGKIWMFFSCLHLDATYPFQWRTSEDNGATWSATRYPVFKNRVDPHTPQPIASAFRDKNGTIYMACDGLGPESLLFASKDEGETWYDTGGRTNGRHSVFVPLKDGSIAAYGGKHTDIDDFMPKSISKDGGKTWVYSPTPFPALGTNQRPSILRLQSGHLFFASDLQRLDGFQLPVFNERGSLVALSEDEGKTWHIKKLPGGEEHESEMHRMAMRGGTLGYSIARQSPNGMIHLIGTMTDHCLHYEFNEAWLLSDEELDDKFLMITKASSIDQIEQYLEYWPDGTIRLEYQGGIADDGRFLMHGKEKWYHSNGSLQYEGEYELGQKIGTKSWWDNMGQKTWEWNYTGDGDTWQQWWPNGNIKAESVWVNGRCEGMANTWDINGKLIQEAQFEYGRLKTAQ